MMERMKKTTKRKLAFLLCMVITLQSVFTGTGAGAMSAKADTGAVENAPVNLTGEPAHAFSKLTADVHGAVEDTGNTLAVRFDMELYEPYLSSIRDQFGVDGETYAAVLDPIAFDEGEVDEKAGSQPANQLFPGGYGDYLNARTDLPEMSFECVLPGTAFDPDQRITGEIKSKADDTVIAAYEMSGQGGNLVITTRVKNSVYSLYDVMADYTLYLDLVNRYEPDTSVEAGPGTGDVDISVNIKGDPLPSNENSGYVIEKTAEREPGDPAGIIWNIHVMASDSNAEKRSAFAATPSDGDLASDPKDHETAGDQEESPASPSNGSLSVSRKQAPFVMAAEQEAVDRSTPSEAETEETGAGEEKEHGSFFDLLKEAPGPDADINLAGTVISDVIPDGLVLVSVEALINSGDGGEGTYQDVTEGTEAGSYELDKDTNTLTYEIPADGDKLVKDAKLRLHTRLSSKLINDYALSLDDTTVYEFSNQVKLFGKGESVPLAVSKRVNETITLGHFMSKIGVPVDSSQQSMKWELDLTSCFSSGVRLYVIDHIEDVEYTHVYDKTEPITMALLDEDGEGTKNEKELKPVYGTAGTYPSYEELINVTKLDELLADKGIDLKKDQVLIYQYDTGVEKKDDKGQGMSVNIQDQVMVIPLTEEYLNGKVTITYHTDTTVGLDNTKGEYLKDQELKNEVKAFWKWPEGVGPGDEFGSLTIEKTWPINYRLVSKKGVGYDYANNELKWEFEVNQYRTNMNRLEIRDAFDPDVQIWAGVEVDGITDPHGDIVLKPVDNLAASRTLPYLTDTPDNEHEGYTLESGTADGKKTAIFTAYIGTTENPVKATEVYTFCINTHLSSGMLEKITQSTAGDEVLSIPNSADIKATIGDKNVEQTTGTVNNQVKNPLIDKEALSFTAADGTTYGYDFNDQAVKWGVTVNPNHWKIGRYGNGSGLITLTDNLPEGTTFLELLDVTMGEDKKSADSITYDETTGKGTISWSDGTSIDYEEAAGTSVHGYKKNQLVFTSNAQYIDTEFYLEFTTHVEEAYRQAEFKSNQETELTNCATLKGSLDEKDFEISDTAVNRIQPYPVTKNGTYFDGMKTLEDGRDVEVKGFHWQVIVNRSHVDMAGATLMDTIVDCMELLPHTLKVQKVALDEQGKLPEGFKETEIGELLADLKSYQFQYVKGNAVSTADTRQFTYTIPYDFKKEEALLISFDTVLVSDSVAADMTNKIEIENKSYKDETNDVQGDGAQNFHVDDYATAKGMYYIKINKTSSNKNGGIKYPLKGAEFTITSGSEGFTEDPAGEKIQKIKITNDRGEANIVFLKPGKTYKVEETNAPVGYETAPVAYVVIPGETDGKKAEYDKLLSIQDEPIQGGNNKIEFYKKGYKLPDSGSVMEEMELPGVEFIIAHEKVTPNPNVVTSGTDGKVSFVNLDLSDKPYRINEKEAPEGYTKSKVIKAYVDVDADGSITTRMEGDKNLTKDETSGNYVLTNQPIKKSGTFTKVDQNGDPIKLKGIKFSVERKNDGVYGTATDNSEFVTYPLCEEVETNADGVVEIKDFLYGEYRLHETNGGKLLNLAKAPDSIYLKVTSAGIQIKQGDYDASAYEKMDKNSTVTNEIQYGYVEVNKVIGEKDALDDKLVDETLESGFVEGTIFAIYSQDASGKAEGTPVMRLKTNADGKFEHDDKGYYTTYLSPSETGKRALLTGKYVLKEETAAAGYAGNSNEYPFEIYEWADIAKPDSKTVVYIDSNDKENPVYSKDNPKASDTKFYNEPLRNSVTLPKEDKNASSKLINGAVFDIYLTNSHSDTKVAVLKEDSHTGKYHIQPVGTVEGGYQKLDPNGRLYVRQKAGGTEYQLLYGTYTLKETTVPDKYQKPGDITLTVGKTVSVKGADTRNNNTITNTLRGADITVQKYVENRKASYDSPNKTVHGGFVTAKNGFVFTLKGTSENGNDLEKTAETGDNGRAVFKDIPIGTYTLTETKIPDAYQKDDGIPWLNKMTKSVSVIVDGTPDTDGRAITITFSDSASGGQAFPDEGKEGFVYGTTDDKLIAIATQNNGKADASLHIANTWKLGAAHGTKIVPLKVSDNPNFYMAGMTFDLYKKGENTPYVTAVSDSSGGLIFEDIPFGDYVLKEQKSLEYEEFKEVLVSIRGSGPTEITSVDETALINQPVRGSGSLKKVDQNGELVLTPITFTVERKNDGLFGNSSDGNYSSYKEVPSLTTKDGILAFDDFLYGEYKLTEDTSALPLTEQPAPVYLKVEKDKFSIGRAADNSGNVTDYKDLASDGSTAIVNKFQYGFVQVKKAVGEKAQDGTGLVEAERPVLLEGVEFDIYRSEGGKVTGDPIMRLRTGKEGTFPYDSSKGTYTSYLTGTPEEKSLMLGAYILKEHSIPAPYTSYLKLDETEYPFEIEAWNAGKPAAVYINSNTPATPGSDADLSKFFNEVKRRGVELEKVDAKTNQPVSGAVFGIYAENTGSSGDILVARLTEQAEGSGIYILSPNTNKDIYAKVKPEGIAYLYGTETDGYKLLYGTYTIKELSTPGDYQKPNDAVTLEVGDTVSVSGTWVNDDGKLTNELKNTSIPVMKFVEQRRPAGSATEFEKAAAAGEGFKFELKGIPSNETDPGKKFIEEAVTDPAGIAKFENVPMGTYTITEIAIPDSYQMGSGAEKTGTLNRMKPVKVIVEGNETGVTVTFTDEEGNALPETKAADIGKDGTQTASGTVNGEKGLYALNTLKLGSAEGTKMAVVHDSQGGEQRVPAEGIEFRLYKGTEADGYMLTAMTTDQGALSFTDLPYGDYLLKEVSKDGYTSADDIAFTVNAENPSAAMVTKGSDVILNVPVRNSGSFTKVDQNGQVITEPAITFAVERKNDGLFGSKGDGKFAPYEEHGKVTASQGILEFKDFLYGEYRLTEKKEDNPDIHWDGEPAPVYLKVTKDKVLIGQKTDSGGNVKDYEELMKDGTTTVMNRLQYGLVEVNKVVGEQDGSGGLTAVSGQAQKLANVKFEIYRQGTDGKADGTPIMTLRTNKDGRFTHDDDGFYTTENPDGTQGKQALLVGKYVLKEVNELSYMEDNTAAYPFEINNWNGESKENMTVLYIDSNKPGAPGTDVSTGFYNEPRRNQITLSKLDEETKVPVSGAEFGVYVDGGAQSGSLVALLKETAAGSGIYALAPAGGSGTVYQEKNPNGLNYLHVSAEGEASTILHGTYIIKETKVPENYENPYQNRTIKLTVGDTVTMQVDDESLVSRLTLYNTMKKASIPMQKYVETRKSGTADSRHDEFLTGNAAQGFTFTMMGTPSNAEKDSEGNEKAFIQEITTGPDGTAEFKNVPMGTYTITETSVPDTYRMEAGGRKIDTVSRMKPVTVTVEGADGTGELKVTFTGQDGTDVPDGGENGFVYEDSANQPDQLLTSAGNGTKEAKLFAANTLKLGDIKGTKVALNYDRAGKEARTPLGGVTFELYQGSVITAESKPYTTSVTSALEGRKGVLEFKNLPYGDYVLKELVPDGYTPVNEQLRVTVSDSAAPAAAMTPGDAKKQITNNVIRKTVRFSKTDQNGDLIKKDRMAAGFKAEKIDGGSPADGIYQNPDTVFTNDGDGTVTLPDLAYGTYRVTETSENDKLLEKPLEPFYIIVERGAEAGESGESTRITLSGSQNPGQDGSHAVSITRKNNDPEDYDFTRNSEHEFKVVNQLKYAKLTFEKAAADQDQNGDLVMGPDAKPLAGVIFKIYQDMDGDGAYDEAADGSEAVLTLVTGNDGRPMTDSEGRYLDEEKKAQDYRMVYGNGYLVKESGFTAESGLAEKYRLDDGFYPFAVTAEYAGTPVYFGTGASMVRMYDGSIAPGNIRFTNGAEGDDWRFPNSQLFRGTAVFEKTDADNGAAVTGAEFELFAVPEDGSEDVRAAAFADDGTGTYGPIPKTEADGFTPLNEANQSWLVLGSDGQYHLLAGNYYIKEVKAPSGYVTPEGEDGKWYFSIEKDRPDAVTADLTDRIGNAKPFTNKLAKQEVSVEKQVETFTKDTYRGILAGEEFAFMLEGTTANGEAFTETVKADQASGKALFENVSGGSYTLTEELTKEQTDIYRTPAKIKVIVEENGVTYEKDGTAADQTMVNDLKRGGVRARKQTHDKDGKELPLKDASFKLTRLSGDGKNSGDTRTAVSGEDGWFAFENLPLGNYLLEETDVPSDYTESGKVWLIEVKEEGVTATQGIELSRLPEGGRLDETEGALKDLRIFNEAIGGITVQKRAEFLKEDGLTGEMKPGEGFRFKISGKTWDGKAVETLAEELTITGTDADIETEAASGTEAGSETETGAETGADSKTGGILVTTKEDGMIRIDGLPAGNYQVTEQINEKNDAQGAYVIDPAAKTADITVKEHRVVSAEVTCSNRLKRSAVQGRKTAADRTTPVRDAVLGLFADKTAEFKEENLYNGLTAVSDEDGIFRFENLPAGTYRIAELTAPGGYRLNSENYYTVQVLEDRAVITTGITEKGETAEIIITNTRYSSGGGGGNTPTKPSAPTGPTQGGPGVPTKPTGGTGASADAETSETSGETVPAETLPDIPPVTPDTPAIPVVKEPDQPPVITVPDAEEGTNVAITERDDNEVIFKGKTDAEGKIYPDIPAGDYTLVILDDNEVPLSAMFLTIEDEPVPLAAPDAGDHSIPTALLAAILLGAAGGLGILIKKRKELDDQEEA